MAKAQHSSPKTPSLKAQLEGLTSATKEQILSVARAWLEAERAAIRAQFLAGGDAGAMLAAHTRMVDALLGALYECCNPLPNPPPERGRGHVVVIIATGGYGREDLFPYSDIDLLFLYDQKSADAAAKIAEFILYILWDLGLKVGQAHRSVDDAIALAISDMTIRTSLLDARFIVGDKKLYQQFRKRFENEVVAGTALEFVEAKLAERDGRHQRFGDSRYMLEPNVKEGKGGLRDLHTLWWIARYIYPIKAIQDLVGMKLLTDEEFRAFDQARQFLWRVRIHLHYLMDRAEERLTFDRQHALAVAMGFSQPSANRSIARFMRRYFVAVRTVGAITRIFCALLEEDKKRKPRRSLMALWQSSWKLGHFRLDGERLNVRSESAFAEQPVLMIELFRVAQINEIDIHPRALQLIARNMHLIDDDLRANPRANGLFLDILLAYQGPEITLRRMSEAGVLGRFIPDFGRVIGLTQFNMYHVYTVDEHTLVALGIVAAVEKGNVREELPLASEIVKRLQMRNVLYLALFCHDIAKGRGGDHSELGEKIVVKLAKRFGFSADEVETASWLVRHHLLFSNTAFRRDIDDPKTILDFVAIVQSPERLKLLLVLTAADIRAVGPGVWNAWKGSLLRELYRRAEQCMGTGEVTVGKHQAGRFREDVLELLNGWSAREVDAYLEQGNAAFWASFDPPRHAMMARMLKEAGGMVMPVLVDTEQDYDRSITEITVVTYDQNALFSKIAGAMSLAGANIINAKVFTLKNGIAVDVFQVQDAAGQVFDRPDKLAKMSVYIEQALAGELDLAAAFAERARGMTGIFKAGHDALPLMGHVLIENNASNIASVIELSGHDRSGFLYDVTRTIAELGLTITTAHISTYGTQAADVFYVKDGFGMKITHEARMKQVREALLRAMSGS